mmetsp:Transcript_11281/g.12754  ORF Transcript_11281/g.12754 Transcript_11281/m.12754 type:complete len:90 (-) Transcript_11281:611-880(-)
MNTTRSLISRPDYSVHKPAHPPFMGIPQRVPFEPMSPSLPKTQLILANAAKENRELKESRKWTAIGRRRHGLIKVQRTCTLTNNEMNSP